MIDLIAPSDFATLRLRDLLPPDYEVEQRRDWEYLDDLWVGEGHGFTETLQLAEAPEETRAIAIDLGDLEGGVATNVLARLRLPLSAGMPWTDVQERLGIPVRTYQWVADRRTGVFQCGPDGHYTVECTVDALAGLVYVTIHRPTPRRFAEVR